MDSYANLFRGAGSRPWSDPTAAFDEAVYELERQLFGLVLADALVLRMWALLEISV